MVRHLEVAPTSAGKSLVSEAPDLYIYIDSQRDKVVTMVTAFRSRLVVSKNRILKGVRGLGLQLLSEVSSFVPLATLQSVLTV